MTRVVSHLHLDEPLYRAVFEHSLDGVLITVPDGRILAANPAACDILGASEEEICRRGRQGFSDEDDPRWRSALEERRRAGRVEAVVPMRRADGGPFFAEVSSAVFVDEQGADRSCVILRDVTARVRLEHELRASTEIARALLAGEPTQRVLTGIAGFARALAEASEVGVVTAGEEPGSVVVVAGDGARMPTLVGRTYPPGTLLARVMASGRSTIVDDLTAAATEEDGRQLGLGPAMIVPIVGGDHVFGNLVVGAGPGRPPYRADTLSAMEVLAQSAGVALTLAQARAAAERASVLAEQSRIAADLHDSVIQQLFAVGLGLQAVSGLAPSPVAERIGESVERLDGVIREIRRTIFRLHRSDPPADLRGEVKEVVDELARHLGYAPALTMSGALDRCDPEIARHVVAVVREALANVLRHSGATEVRVSVTESAGQLLVEVADDGAGLPERRREGYGVRNLARRAEALGGHFTVGPARPRGTSVQWQVPLRPMEEASGAAGEGSGAAGEGSGTGGEAPGTGGDAPGAATEAPGTSGG